MEEIIREGTKATLKVPVDITATTEQSLRKLLKEILAGGVTELTMDLTLVRMVDSVGIGLLISAHNSLSKVGGALIAVNVSNDLMDLFKNMRLHQHFTIKPA